MLAAAIVFISLLIRIDDLGLKEEGRRKEEEGRRKKEERGKRRNLKVMEIGKLKEDEEGDSNKKELQGKAVSKGETNC